jgi:hypothetical protein
MKGKVLVVEAVAHSNTRDIRRAAEVVADETRRLSWDGYDLRHISCKVILLRNDRPFVPRTEVEREEKT